MSVTPSIVFKSIEAHFVLFRGLRVISRFEIIPICFIQHEYFRRLCRGNKLQTVVYVAFFEKVFHVIFRFALCEIVVEGSDIMIGVIQGFQVVGVDLEDLRHIGLSGRLFGRGFKRFRQLGNAVVAGMLDINIFLICRGSC